MLRETPSILHTFQHESGVATLALSPDEQWLATVTISETVQIWPLGDGATGVETGDVQPPLIQGPAQETWNLKPFSAGGQWLVSGAPDGAVYLWPIGENPATEPRIFAHEGAVVDAEVSPDGRWLVAAGGSPNHTATVWSLTGEDNGDAYVLDGYEDQVWDAAFSPDGSLLATASWDGAARLYRVPHFDAPPTILQRVARPMTIARFSPDGKWLAAASHTLWLWPAGDLDAEPIVLSGHQNEIKDFAFGPNEAWVVTASWDQTVRLWNLNAPDAGAQVLRDHDDRVAGVVFDPNGRWIASVGEKSAVIRLWRVRDDALIELACARAGRGLTRGEWARYFRADQPYQPVCS
jgi:WD40 repeat protein